MFSSVQNIGCISGSCHPVAAVRDVSRQVWEDARRWMDLTLLHEVMAEARAEISLVRNALSAIRPV
ncbi:hypothetical protein FOB96_21980 (plasmid) [Salmonella enterica]|nr:hypothetical protein [Salmonella enterica]EEE9969100.1 hypothetical protein [Salmonella enterica subsp. enterica serovar Nigeria]QGR44507.1 hypothetical protein FOB96_21980 [Salmonella enterica]